ncbi:MAG TPA: hypothetical protein VIU15_46990, partial [Streptomyces sp.]
MESSSEGVAEDRGGRVPGEGAAGEVVSGAGTTPGADGRSGIAGASSPSSGSSVLAAGRAADAVAALLA